MPFEKITGIVINAVRHSDRSNVVTLYTRERGRVPFISPVGSGKAGRMRNSRLMPLSVITADINFHSGRELQNLGAISPYIVWKDIYFNPLKSTVALFLYEFLNRYLRDATPDKATWDFIVKSLSFYDMTHLGAANFHIWFLIAFMTVAGINPDISDLKPGDMFDMRAGVPFAGISTHHDILSAEQATLIPLFLRMTPANLHRFRLNGAQRRALLDIILKYYSIHFPGLSGLRSPDILSEVFG